MLAGTLPCLLPGSFWLTITLPLSLQFCLRCCFPSTEHQSNGARVVNLIEVHNDGQTILKLRFAAGTSSSKTGKLGSERENHFLRIAAADSNHMLCKSDSALHLQSHKSLILPYERGTEARLLQPTYVCICLFLIMLNNRLVYAHIYAIYTQVDLI